MTLKGYAAPDFILRDQNYKERVIDSFGRQGFMRNIGAKIEHLAPGQCTIAVPFHENVAQQHGFFHGGVVGAVADNAGAYAAFTLIEADQSMLTVEYKVNFIAPSKGDFLRAEAQVLKGGRTLTISRVDLFSYEEDIRRHCATALVTMMLLQGQGDS